ncbi:MAG: tRNA (adenosine(37)-N6)-threonylcarbamoyltransferase complex ATPase subunit type 1 TsaE [Chloroflexota bacterium]|nr:MAG: tRNA (adenosine(37)-N6)-threonylcarbamoyltransferase complex ATPase subunit type 1 TsaE [Chloroflexota bacterium]
MEERSIQIVTRSAKQTEEIGRLLGGLAEPGDLYLLVGELGAGKTTLARGIARGLGIEGYLTSPTFTLVNEYEGRLPFYHIDLYRLEGLGEVMDLGFEEYLSGRGVTAIEWPEKAEGLLPESYLLISLDAPSVNRRRIDFRAEGARYEELMDQLARRLKS